MAVVMVDGSEFRAVFDCVNLLVPGKGNAVTAGEGRFGNLDCCKLQ